VRRFRSRPEPVLVQPVDQGRAAQPKALRRVRPVPLDCRQRSDNHPSFNQRKPVPQGQCADPRSLLTHLEHAGALTSARRELLEALANEALAARQGNAPDVLASLGETAAVSRTFGTEVSPTSPERVATANEDRAVPAEREGQYTRLGELGRGGQSVVRRAVDEFVGREVALKELLVSPESADASPSESTARQRFLREARLTAQLDHPGIVAVHELARRADGTLFCAQKLIRGETLKARFARCESLRQRLELLPHLIDACDAVAYAHSRGVIHRDLKPSNIMIGAFGETVVVDWGLAKKRGEAEAVDASVSGSSRRSRCTGPRWEHRPI